MYNLVCSKKFCVYFPPAAPHHGTVQPNIGDRPILPGCRQLTLGALYSHFTVISDLRQLSGGCTNSVLALTANVYGEYFPPLNASMKLKAGRALHGR